MGIFGKKYRVKPTGRAGLIYKEGDRTMTIDSEMLADGEFDYVIYTKSMNAWDPPHQDEPVTIADKQRIRENITRALHRSRIDWQDPRV